MYLWDIRKLDKEVDSTIIDTSANICTPFVDRELKLIYTVGKEESKIRIFDYSEQKFKKLPTFNSNISSDYSVFFNRTCLDNKRIEIGRFARYSRDNNSIYYASFMINDEKEFSEHLLSNNHFENSLITFDDWVHKKDNLINELSERKKKFEELEQSFKLKKSSENLIKNQKKNEDTTINHLNPKIDPLKLNEFEKQKMNEVNNKKNKEVENKAKLKEEENKISENNKILENNIKLNKQLLKENNESKYLLLVNKYNKKKN